MRKNILLLFFSTIISIILLYLFLIVYTFYSLEIGIPHKFHSNEIINFHKKYSSKIHHIRLDERNFKKNFEKTEYLYSIINEFGFEKKNILFQGDSWVEQLTNPDDDNFSGLKYIKKFSIKNNLGFISAGVTSYSPTLMKLQLEILEKDFGILPNIIIAYIDQTDIGDENCRYKNSRIFKNNNLVAVKVDNFSNSIFNLSKVYGESKILLERKSKIKQSFYLLNFRVKYNLHKFKNKNLAKIKRIKNYGYKNRKNKKCYWSNIQNYLINSTNSELEYFEESLTNYINYALSKNNIEKIFIVTFPHKNHILELLDGNENLYKHNVSDIVDKLIANKESIYHLNFTKLINEKKIRITKDDYIANDPSSHLIPAVHRNMFIKRIVNYVLNII